MSDCLDFDLTPEDNPRLANMCGQFNGHLRQIEKHFDVNINSRGNHFQIYGQSEQSEAAMNTIKALYDVADTDALVPSTVQLFLNDDNGGDVTEKLKEKSPQWNVKTRKGSVQGRGKNQKQYLEQIKTNDLALGVGPAGTGKTYLAVACAVDALVNDEVDRLILVRPAVEAGERLGFLPGDLSQKIDPYLRPMYDALYEMMGIEKVAKLIEKNVIEIAPRYRNCTFGLYARSYIERCFHYS